MITSMVVKFHNMKYVPLLIFQFILMALYFVFTKYDGDHHHDVRGFEDTHVMIFIGFGFLMTFLKKYCYSALGFNWFLAALSVQWALLCQSFYHMKDNVILINKETLLEADIMTATVLITFGSVLGIASSSQLLLVAIIEVVVGCFNFWLVGDYFQAADVGGSIAIHAFGAYFGLGLSWALHFKKKDPPPPAPPTSSSFSPFNLSQSTSAAPAVNLNLPSYNSDVTAMIGSIFLFIYWPSFNSALTKTNEEYQRAVINSYLSLASATVTTFVMSSLVSHHKGKLDMVHIQNSTLAGGVAVGSVCNMHISAGGAIAIGIGAGFLSVLGYRFLTPILTKIRIHDTCGVNNLHGMPGVYSGILTAVFAAMATKEQYKDELDNIFPAMKGETGISASQQGINQLLAVVVTLVVAIVGGAITGFIARFVKPLKKEEKYNDEIDWDLP